MEQRSTFVTVVGWLFIVFSGLFMLEALVFMFIPFDKMIPKMPPPQGGPAPDPVLFTSIMHGMWLVMAAFAAWILLSSIGLVMRKNWARISFLVFMFISEFFCVIYFLIGLFGAIFMPSAGLPGQPPEMAGIARGMMVFMLILSLVFGGLYGWIIHKLNTESIKQ